MKRVAFVLAGGSLVLAVTLSASAGGRHANATHVQAAENCIRAALRKEDLAVKYIKENSLRGVTIGERVLEPALDDLECALAAISKAHGSGEISEAEAKKAEADVNHAYHEDHSVRSRYYTFVEAHGTGDLAVAKNDKERALAILERAATRSTHSYRYNVTIAADGTGDNFVDAGTPGPPVTDTGSMSASYSMVFPVVFTVDLKAHTVDAEPPTPGVKGAMPSSSGSGTDSFTLTTVQGQQTNTCTIPANTPFSAAGALADVWGGGPDIKSYEAGQMFFTLSGNSDTRGTYPCSPTTVGTIAIGQSTVPGFSLNPDGYPGCSAGNSRSIPIPMSDLGQRHVVTTFALGPLSCQSTRLDANYTAHLKYTITLDLHATR